MTLICRSILLMVFVISTAITLQSQVAQLNLLSNWQKDGLVGSSNYNNTYNEVWGMSINGSEYAIIGSTAGTHIINIDDPTAPVESFFIEGAENGSVIIHRDYHDHQGFLYAVADEGQSTMQIIDMRSLPDTVKVVYDSREYIRRSHNIFIDTSSSILYSCVSGGDDINYTPLRLFDISQPDTIVPIENFNAIEAFTFSQVHDAYVRNDTAFLNCGPGGFAIADFSNPSSPSFIAGLRTSEYEQAGYNHSGWLSDDGSQYFMADETWGMDIKVLDLSSLPDIRINATLSSEGPDYTIPHNQIVHGNLLYSSYYYEGIQVWDISKPENITRIAEYDTYDPVPMTPSYAGAWGVYPFLPSGKVLVSDMQSGLYIFEPPALLSNTSENSEEIVSLQVFPNPATDIINIKTQAPISNYTIYNLTGQSILSGILNQNKIDISSLHVGIYWLKLNSSDGLSKTVSFSKL